MKTTKLDFVLLCLCVLAVAATLAVTNSETVRGAIADLIWQGTRNN